MIDKIIAIGIAMDWISPVMSMINDALRGSRVDFAIPWDCGWSANEVGYLLELHGVDCWGLMVRNEVILFSIKKSQYRWVKYILVKNEIIENWAEE